MLNENLENKKNKYKELAKKTTLQYKNNMKAINGVIEAIENNSGVTPGDTLETIIFKKYLELENVKKVSNYINELGHRVKTGSYIGERKYTSNDITGILTNKDCLVEKKLRSIVQFLQDKNYTAMSEIWREN